MHKKDDVMDRFLIPICGSKRSDVIEILACGFGKLVSFSFGWPAACIGFFLILLTPEAHSQSPSAREGHSTVWAGAEMIVWGGWNDHFDPDDEYFNDGARYDPVSRTWSVLSSDGAPSARYSHAAVWTGSEMIVWGGWIGNQFSGSFLNDGARYNPADDTWTPMSSSVLSARRNPTVIWTGSEMIIWGGRGVGGIGGSFLNDGARYNPANDTWTPISSSPLSARREPTAVWTGDEMIVWGGSDGGSNYFNNGARYDPTTDTWSGVSTTGAPSNRDGHTAVWTGDEMIVWGGYGESSLNDGGRYNPADDSWIAVSAVDALPGRGKHTAVWTGAEMIVWGGGEVFQFGDGASFDPNSNSWSVVNQTGAPSKRVYHSGVWTGSKMIIWGGHRSGPGNSGLGDGAGYDPKTDTWSELKWTQSDSFSELFTDQMGFDLDGKMITFTPQPSGYTYFLNSISALPTDPALGTGVWPYGR